jgi:hypothetical protein
MGDLLGLLIARVLASAAPAAGAQRHGVNDEDAAVRITEERDLDQPIALSASDHQPSPLLTSTRIRVAGISDHRFGFCERNAMPGYFLAIPLNPSE